MSAKRADKGSGEWLPAGATAKKKTGTNRSKPGKPAARKRAASSSRPKTSEWLPSPGSTPTASGGDANGSRAAKRSWKPKGKTGLTLERRKLRSELRTARVALEQERARNAELTEELEKLKKAGAKKPAKRSAKPKASAKRRAKSSR
jgi:hypothetical protein